MLYKKMGKGNTKANWTILFSQTLVQQRPTKRSEEKTVVSAAKYIYYLCRALFWTIFECYRGQTQTIFTLTQLCVISISHSALRTI